MHFILTLKVKAGEMAMLVRSLLIYIIDVMLQHTERIQSIIPV